MSASDASAAAAASAAEEPELAAASAAAEAAATAVQISQDADPTIGIVVAVVVVLLSLYFFLCRGGGGKGGSVVLFGPMGGGKTAMYVRLRFGRTLPTHTSLSQSKHTFAVADAAVAGGGGGGGGRALTVVDAPGTGRLRHQLLAELPNCALLVCVLDATQLAPQAKDAAGVLYDVLSHEAVARRAPRLLVVLNKSDLKGAAAAAAARKQLEAEMESVKLARTTLQDTSERAARGALPEGADGRFSFAALRGGVDFVASSATKDAPGLGELVAAMNKFAG